MKPRGSKLPSLFVGAMLMITASFNACTGLDDDEDAYRVNATLSGAQERPTPTNSAATGTLTGSYNRGNNMLMYTLTWSGLTGAPDTMHFHGPAAPEEAAPPVVGIGNFPDSTSGSVSNSITLTEEQETQLLDGKWYVNIHTPTFGSGEIRGQLHAAN